MRMLAILPTLTLSLTACGDFTGRIVRFDKPGDSPYGDWDPGGGGYPDSLDATEQAALVSLFPLAYSVVVVTTPVVYFQAIDVNGDIMGWVFFGDNRGWGGPIESLTGLDSDGVIIRVEPTWWGYETPGFVDPVISRSWLGQFDGIDSAQVDVETRNWGPYEIDTVTGATVSSRALIDNAWDALAEYGQVAP